MSKLARLWLSLWRRPALCAMHFALVLIAIGGTLTWLTSVRGSVHLRPHTPTTTFVGDDGRVYPLPTPLTLDTFRTDYYPGMSFPRDFRSEVTTGHGDRLEISMNHIGRVADYRLTQSSFDGEGGTVLSVSRDPYGIAVTYTGYVLFIVAGAVYLCTYWRLRHRTHHRSTLRENTRLLSFAFILLPFAASAAMPTVSEERAEALERQQVIMQGRVLPFGTVAQEFTLKLTGRRTVAGMSPTRFVASVALYPEQWASAPIIKIDSKALADSLGARDRLISPAALYTPKGVYRPQRLYKGGAGAMDKSILKLDERVALLASLCEGTLFTPLPEGDPDRRSECVVTLQLLYDRAQPTLIVFILLVAGAFLSVCRLSFIGGESRRRGPEESRTSTSDTVGTVVRTYGLIGSCLLVLSLFVWKWVILGYVPLSSGSEIMVFVSLALTVGNLLIYHRLHSRMVAGLVLLMAAFPLLVAHIAGKDPAMTPLMPVLDSPWLAVHVSVVMIAYAVLALTFPLSLVALISRRRRARLSKLSLGLLRPGTYLMGVGIILGSMWANVSWGRYWDWDPKETWSLITLLVYALPLHRVFGLYRRPRALSIYLLLAILAMLMTYAGVNFLPSLHAYN